MSDDKKLRKEIGDLREALMTALWWMASSANSPLRIDEVKEIEKIANGKAKP